MTVHARLGAEIETNVDAWVEQIVSRVRHEVPTLVRDDMTTELGLSSSRALLLEFAAKLRAAQRGLALAFERVSDLVRHSVDELECEEPHPAESFGVLGVSQTGCSVEKELLAEPVRAQKTCQRGAGPRQVPRET